MDIRIDAGVSQNYYMINREERFYCAVLFSLLTQKNDNLKRFISYLNNFLDVSDKVDESRVEEFELYVEYAYLRDIWDAMASDNEKKLGLIFKALNMSNNKLTSLNWTELNNAMVGSGKASHNHVQSPGTWSISKYAQYFTNDREGNDDFKKVCKFKWSFNIKPDIVIQVNPKRVTSIEAKLESREGTYPSTEAHKAEFTRRGLDPVKQIDLQKFMFEKILNTDVSIFYLLKNNKQKVANDNEVHKITWQDVFNQLSFEDSHPFLIKSLKAKGLCS